MSKKNRPSRPLRLESLESRYTLAGDVNVVLSGNNLTITGDAEANDVHITQNTATKTIHIEGVGTNILLKGENGAAFQDVVISDLAKLVLKIDLKGGDDNLQIGQFVGDTVTAKTLSAKLGAGVDSVHILNTHITGTGGSSASVILGKNSEIEHDVLDVEQSNFAGGVKVVAGGGQNDVFFTQTNVDKVLSILGGKQDDAFIVQNGTVAKSNIKLGDGTNTLTANGINGTLLSVTGGKGVDTVNASTVSSPKIKIKTGKGNDVVNADHLTVSSSLSADGGGDIDVINFQASTSVFPVSTSPKNFETVNLT